VLKGEKYVSHAEWVEREEAKAGPLPAGVKVPKFDGSILKYQKWWDHFRSLIHENKRVSQFWKMQYLLQAMEGVAASVLAGFEGLASEYPEALETVQKRYGKEHLVVRHIIHSVMNRDAPTKEAVSFGSFIEDTSSIYVLLQASLQLGSSLGRKIFLSLYVALTTSLAANFSIGGGGQHLPNRFSARIGE